MMADYLHAFAPILVALGAILFVGLLMDGLSVGRRAPKMVARPLMTKIERETIGYIEAAVSHARVHAQVSMGALLRSKPGLTRSEATATRNRFSSKRVDYVLESRFDGSIIALVELDDRSHDAQADAVRDRLTAAAGYLTIRLPAGERPTMVKVADRIRAALQPPAPSVTPAVSTARRRATLNQEVTI